MLYATQRFSLSNGAASQDLQIAGISWTPVAAKFSAVRATVDDTSATTLGGSYGFTDGTTQAVLAWYVGEGSTPNTECDTFHRSDSVIVLPNGAGAIDTQISFDSFITGGVALDFDNSPGSDWFVIVEFFGGADLSAEVGFIDIGTGNADVTVSSLSFEPDFLHLLAGIGDFSTDETAANLSIGVGVVDFTHSDDQAGTWFTLADNVATVAPNGYITTTAAIQRVASALAADRVTFDNPTSTGFDASWSSAVGSTTIDIAYLAIASQSSVAIDNIAAPISPSPQTQTVTGLGFAPIGVQKYNGNQNNSALDQVNSGNLVPIWGIGVTDGTRTNATTQAFRNNRIPTETFNTSTTGDLTHTTNHRDAAFLESTLTSLDSDGWTEEFIQLPAGTQGKNQLIIAYGPGIVRGEVAFSGIASLNATADTVSSGSASFTGNGDLNAVANVVVSASANLQGESDLTATARTVTDGSAAIAGTGNINATATGDVNGSASFSGTADLNAVAMPDITGAAMVGAIADLVATGSTIIRAQSSLAGTANLTADGTIKTTVRGEASFTGTANLTAPGTTVSRAASSASGTADFNASARTVAHGTANASGTADLNADGSVLGTVRGEVAFNGTADFNLIDPEVISRGQANASGTGDLNAVATTVVRGAAAFSGTANLDADGRITSVVRGEASFSGTSDLNASARTTISGSSAASGTGNLNASASTIVRATANAEGIANVFADASSGIARGQVAFSGTASLNAAANPIVAGSASANGTASLNAVASSVANGAAALEGTANIDADGSVGDSVKGEVAFSGTAGLNAVGSTISRGSAGMEGTASLNAAGLTIARSFAFLGGTADIGAIAKTITRGIGLFSGIADLFADGTTGDIVTGQVAFLGTAILAADGTVIGGTPQVAFQGTATLTADGTVIGGLVDPTNPFDIKAVAKMVCALEKYGITMTFEPETSDVTSNDGVGVLTYTGIAAKGQFTNPMEFWIRPRGSLVRDSFSRIIVPNNLGIHPKPSDRFQILGTQWKVSSVDKQLGIDSTVAYEIDLIGAHLPIVEGAGTNFDLCIIKKVDCAFENYGTDSNLLDLEHVPLGDGNVMTTTVTDSARILHSNPLTNRFDGRGKIPSNRTLDQDEDASVFVNPRSISNPIELADKILIQGQTMKISRIRLFLGQERVLLYEVFHEG